MDITWYAVVSLAVVGIIWTLVEIYLLIRKHGSWTMTSLTIRHKMVYQRPHQFYTQLLDSDDKDDIFAAIQWLLVAGGERGHKILKKKISQFKGQKRVRLDAELKEFETKLMAHMGGR